jgi:hypothetical protein
MLAAKLELGELGRCSEIHNFEIRDIGTLKSIYMKCDNSSFEWHVLNF